MTKRLRDNLTAYTFLAPFLIIFLTFLVYPIFYSLYLSFHRVVDLYDVFGNMKFVGLDNFGNLIHDGQFWWSLLMTFYYAALVIPFGIILSLFLALLLNNRLPFRSLFRSAYFMPYVLDMFVVGIVWVLIYSPHFGVLNRLFSLFGIDTFLEKGFLGNPWSAMPAVALANVLKASGFGMILYLAAIANISPSLYEAAAIDGANGWQRFRAITYPLLKPITLFLVIIGVIGSLNAFAEIYAMTEGGPNVEVGGRALGATWVTGYYLFRTFYVSLKLGYAAAISYVLLILTLIISVVNMRLFRTERA
jgi:multiple sugar transport system permease protein